jgi:hypothetical protein
LIVDQFLCLFGQLAHGMLQAQAGGSLANPVTSINSYSLQSQRSSSKKKLDEERGDETPWSVLQRRTRVEDSCRLSAGVKAGATRGLLLQEKETQAIGSGSAKNDARAVAIRRKNSRRSAQSRRDAQAAMGERSESGLRDLCRAIENLPPYLFLKLCLKPWNTPTSSNCNKCVRWAGKRYGRILFSQQ